MLAKRKKNMFMSFRGEPRDIQTELHLNVRRGLANLANNNKDEEDGIASIPRQLNDLTIEDMTSIDISNDLRAYFRTHERSMRDIILAKKWWKAICCNANLFKGKVFQMKPN